MGTDAPSSIIADWSHFLAAHAVIRLTTEGYRPKLFQVLNDSELIDLAAAALSVETTMGELHQEATAAGCDVKVTAFTNAIGRIRKTAEDIHREALAGVAGPVLYTIQDVAARLHTTPAVVRRLIESGKLGTIQPGAVPLIPALALRSYIGSYSPPSPKRPQPAKRNESGKTLTRRADSLVRASAQRARTNRDTGPKTRVERRSRPARRRLAAR